MQAENTPFLNEFISAVEQSLPSFAPIMQSLQAGQEGLSPEEQKAIFLSEIKGQYLKLQLALQSNFRQELLNQSHNYHRERLSQARSSFSVALALIIVGALIIFAGVILLGVGSLQAGTITLVSGTIINVVNLLGLKFYKDSGNRLDKTADWIDAQVAKEMGILSTVNLDADLFASTTVITKRDSSPVLREQGNAIA